jgi:hypothetical protein
MARIIKLSDEEKEIVEFFKDAPLPLCNFCGAPNPDHGPVCGNCEKDPFGKPEEEDGTLSPEQKVIAFINKRELSNKKHNISHCPLI